ncbi:hypothetical protein OEA41_000022 [Lepraria neglecta]|uniref:Uncharacterized protein n=1 Tax=Lepraria neglecta TaxID=209136 RepID=A0AAD9ZF75_9LECA|nr:hypothetical protein OEA41_000022 [Lepraria neglecta]
MRTDILFIIEYKAPHKLTKDVLRADLRAIDIPKEAINRPTIPTDLQEKFNYNADRLVAAVATQPYSYMLKSSVEYSYIITREAMLLSFCLIARSTRRNELYRNTSINKAQTWSEDWEEILRNIPREDRKLNPPHSAFKARRYSIAERSRYYLRKKKPMSYRSGCSLENKPIDDGRDDPAGDSGNGPESINTPSKRRSANQSQEGNRGRGTRDSASTGNQRRQYYTQGCLLGLVGRSALDGDCPYTHLLSKQQFGAMVQRQFPITLNLNCTDLKSQGSRGALFRIILASHGYTFVGKGTRDVFVPEREHERRMYDPGVSR